MNFTQQTADLSPADVLAIHAAIYAYSAGIDTKDYELFASVFTEDCTVHYGSGDEMISYHGRDRLVAEMERIHRRLDASLHRVSNIRVSTRDKSDVETVNCRSYVDALLVRAGADGGDTFQAIGFYDDVLRHDGDAWRIATRSFIFVQAIGNPLVPDTRPVG